MRQLLAVQHGAAGQQVRPFVFTLADYLRAAIEKAKEPGLVRTGWVHMSLGTFKAVQDHLHSARMPDGRADGQHIQGWKETGEAATIGYGEREYQRENSHGIAHQSMGLQLIRESIDAERLRRRSAAQGLREKVKTAAGRETMRIKAELKYASADRAVEELHAAYDEAVAAREGAEAAAGTEGA
ncbi:hypothetical protein EMIHUDRAFT_202339 [Emiliania huxleyi CCMP1516]|uniref:Uncharacterized protein n=2 Tax=Emiliania huxleyi TaxID=2903 RepID=A0A0D3KBK9_EMIH1|nr:hypothetical protein EMIHUDRAFT_202339 [Emiliania huxleyi CCMP1516]EOD33144.1 hypothetical protein EMIHUDRAFT_202339 [Emiliania huxleyi CCMP1516]|eukprot:XP_005785573.1 hypothetical protein EMIHUDRAFT_202339 [Emiliania huxleyi CCMP1516]